MAVPAPAVLENCPRHGARATPARRLSPSLAVVVLSLRPLWGPAHAARVADSMATQGRPCVDSVIHVNSQFSIWSMLTGASSWCLSPGAAMVPQTLHLASGTCNPVGQGGRLQGEHDPSKRGGQREVPEDKGGDGWSHPALRLEPPSLCAGRAGTSGGRALVAPSTGAAPAASGDTLGFSPPELKPSEGANRSRKKQPCGTFSCSGSCGEAPGHTLLPFRGLKVMACHESLTGSATRHLLF